MIRWLLISIFLIGSEIVAIVITPLIVAFADRNSGNLPRAFWWMETPTARLPGAKGFVRENLPKYGWYCTAVLWLWRNAVYALCDQYRVDPDWRSVQFRYFGNKFCNNDPYMPGCFFGVMSWRGGSAWELRVVFPMPRNRCFMFRAGWKLSAWFEGRRRENPGATGMFQPPSIRPLLSRK